MSHESIRIIHEEHTTLSALLRSLDMMVKRGPVDQPAAFFEVLRAMLFYIDEFPERQHHPKETELLFPPVAARDAEAAAAIARLDQDHARGEAEVRELQHLLVAWEMLGEPRRAAFEQALARYLAFYGEHMRLEESVVIPAAQRVLTEAEWAELDAAFAANTDPLSGKYPRDPVYDRLFTQILGKAPAPIGLG
ncbi:MAG: hemerythrin [Polaromonas sp.]|nr:hemerythrin [Polaromonas sp.]